MKKFALAAALLAVASLPAAAYSFSYGGVSVDQPAAYASPYDTLRRGAANDNYATLLAPGSAVPNLRYGPTHDDSRLIPVFAYNLGVSCSGCGVDLDPYWRRHDAANTNQPA